MLLCIVGNIMTSTLLPQHKPDAKLANTFGNFWRDRQLRDYRKANYLCFHCGEKFEPGHLDVYAKKNKPHINALALNDLDRIARYIHYLGGLKHHQAAVSYSSCLGTSRIFARGVVTTQG
jgi:hypothetical protein